MNKIFFIADLHFGHQNIIDYESRPFTSVEIMDNTLIKNWNNVVSKKDKVLIAGDFSFYGKEKTIEIVSQLYGHKILVMGNHDKGRGLNWWYEVGFNEVYKYPIIYDEWYVIGHEPPQYINPNYPYFYIYGHVHGSENYKTITKQTACVSVERWDYTPVEIEKIKDLIKLLE